MPAYPVIEDTDRPYHLWHANAKKDNKYLPWRRYSNAFRAVIGAWVWQKRYGKVNDVVEVVDVRTAKLIGQYKQTLTSVTFHNENHRVIQAALEEIINSRIPKEHRNG